jgi:hypothetical protein
LELLVGFRERLLARPNVGATNRVPTLLVKLAVGFRGLPLAGALNLERAVCAAPDTPRFF